jgi:hypothetical protein
MGNVYPQTGYLRLFDDVQQKFQLCREVTRLSDSREKVYAGGVTFFSHAIRGNMRCLFFSKLGTVHAFIGIRSLLFGLVVTTAR